MRRSFTLFLVIISHLCSSYAASAALVVGTPATSIENIRSYIRAVPGSQSYARQKISSKPEAKNLERLESAFAHAQKTFFQNTTEKARDAFEAVLGLRLEADWTQAQQQVFISSALRVFELSSKERKASAVITAAIAGPKTQLDESVFSPSTKEAFLLAQTEIKYTSVPVTGWMKSFEWLRFNGRDYDIADVHKIRVPQGKFRFSFYSSRFQDVTMVTTADGLLLRKVQPSPLLTTNCKPTKQFDFEQNLTRLDADQLCQKQKSLARSLPPKIKPAAPVESARTITKPKARTQQLEFEAEHSPTPLESQPAASVESPRTIAEPKAGTQQLQLQAEHSLPPLESRLPQTNQTLAKTQTSKKWYQNKWTWIGVSLAAVAFIAIDQSQNSRDGSSRTNPSPVSYEK